MLLTTERTGQLKLASPMTLAEMSHLEAMLPDGECRAHQRFAQLRAEVLSHDVNDSVWRTQQPHDCIDEALMESFPASDPPSYTTCHC